MLLSVLNSVTFSTSRILNSMNRCPNAFAPSPITESADVHHTDMLVCRPPPIESRRAGLRGGKPEEQTHSSPDENRPSNDQATTLEAGTDGPGSDSNADSRQQAAAEPGNNATFLDGRPEASEPYDNMQDNACDGHQEYMQNGHHALWSSNVAAPPMLHRSFAVGVDPVHTVPYTKPGDTNHSFFT